MSKYYDSGPFKLEQWNQLIKDVNDILQNPKPAGSDCQPIDPLEEASDPHVWAVKDITDVRDALKKTCPKISFTNDTILWKNEIIDEIEEQMKDAWCNCSEGGPETIEGDCPSHSYQTILASPYNKIINQGNGYEDAVRNSGNLVRSSPCYICVGSHCQEAIWTGSYYDCHYETLVALISQIGDDWGGLYKVAYQRTYDYIAAVNHEMIEARNIEKYQGQLDPIVTQIDSAISVIKAGPPNSPAVQQAKSLLHNLGPRADQLQTQVDQHVSAFAGQDALREPARTEADAAAQALWSCAMSLPTQFPCDANLAHEIDPVIKDMPWSKWLDPNKDMEVGDLMSYAYNSWGSYNYPDKGEVRPCFVNNFVHSAKPGLDGPIGSIRLSPGGYPFCSNNCAAQMVRVYGLPYVVTSNRWRCEGVLAVTCGALQCQFFPWSPAAEVYWSKGCADERSWSAWLWIPITKPDPASKGSETLHTTITRLKGRMGVDNTKKQTDYWNDHLKWYDKHEKYDHRHTQYW